MITELENDNEFKRKQEALASNPTHERYELYLYYPGEITDFPSSLSVKVLGNASLQIVEGNKVSITSEDFETHFTVNSSTYSSGYTTIVVGTSFSNTSQYGGLVGVVHDITDRVLKEPNLSLGLEGDTLHEFDSGGCNIDLDNSNNTFWNEVEKEGWLYSITVASTISAVTTVGSSLTNFILNSGSFIDNFFTGYFITMISGAEEEEVFSIVASSGSSIQIWAQEEVNVIVGDEFIINKSRESSLRVTGGYKGIYSGTESYYGDGGEEEPEEPPITSHFRCLYHSSWKYFDGTYTFDWDVVSGWNGYTQENFQKHTVMDSTGNIWVLVEDGSDYILFVSTDDGQTCDESYVVTSYLGTPCANMVIDGNDKLHIAVVTDSGEGEISYYTYEYLDESTTLVDDTIVGEGDEGGVHVNIAIDDWSNPGHVRTVIMVTEPAPTDGVSFYFYKDQVAESPTFANIAPGYTVLGRKWIEIDNYGYTHFMVASLDQEAPGGYSWMYGYLNWGGSINNATIESNGYFDLNYGAMGMAIDRASNRLWIFCGGSFWGNCEGTTVTYYRKTITLPESLVWDYVGSFNFEEAAWNCFGIGYVMDLSLTGTNNYIAICSRYSGEVWGVQFGSIALGHLDDFDVGWIGGVSYPPGFGKYIGV